MGEQRIGVVCVWWTNGKFYLGKNCARIIIAPKTKTMRQWSAGMHQPVGVAIRMVFVEIEFGMATQLVLHGKTAKIS